MILKKLTLNINGVDKMFVCDQEKDTLLDVIRNLGLTGTKGGCGKGQCGACSVLLDGKVIRACTRKISSIPEYSKLVTIEGIGTPANLHPLQLAWTVYGGVQCGFCSPGFIVSAKGLLDVNPSPTREDVRDWFQKHRNACRCTGYKPLVDAVMAAAEVLRCERTMEDLVFKIPTDGRIYGTYQPRPAAISKVTGVCDYGDDINVKLPDGALYVAPVLIEANHARILSIDFEEAEKMSGVVKVITAKDVKARKGMNRITWPTGWRSSKINGFERPILVEDILRRRGDVCALVVASSRREAREAAQKVKIDFEQLPEYMNALDAVAEGALEIHKGVTKNIYVEQPLIKGDAETAFDKAAHVVEGSFYSQRQPHLVIEPDTILAFMGEDDTLTIHCKSLYIYGVAPLITAGIGYPKEKIRVIENPTGASFGYSLSPINSAIVAIATLVTGKPCAMTLSYEEHQHMTGKRAPSFSNVKLASDEHGKIQALEFEMAYDKGPYSETTDVVNKGARFMAFPYTIPNAFGLCTGVMTNHNFTTAYRSFGSTQAYTASEQLMDILAEKIGLDPWEIRYKNVYRPGDISLNGHTMDAYPMAELLEQIHPSYLEAVESAKKETTPEFRRGVGIVCGGYNVSSTDDSAEVALELNSDGTVTHFNSWAEQGQGSDVGTLVHTHEALRPLGLTPDQIRLVQNDTATTPRTGPAATSRCHFMAGNATINAAGKLMDAMRKTDESFRTYQEMIAEEIPTKYLGRFDITGLCTGLDPNTGQGNPTPLYTYGVFMAEVEVEMATGKTKVLKMACYGDVGVIGSRQAVEGQAYGGLMQSVGMALSEDYEDVKKDTNLIASGFPFIKDVPDDMELFFLETPRKIGPHGSSGCAELFQTSPHVAIINAIKNASGVRVHELPATPEKVLAGIKAIEKGEKPFAPKKYYLGQDLHERMDEISKNPW